MLNLTIYAYLGPASPFFLYTLGTPLLAGLLFRTTRRRSCSAAAMLVGYYVLVVLSGNGLDELRAHEARDIQALVVLPALYPLAAAGGAAVRGLLDRQAVTQLALASAERRAAAGAERARVAREMHDSLGKTLYGIALAARGLSHRVEAEAPGAAAAARDLSASAQVAAEEARGLISDLRSDTLDRPLGDALERYVREWSDRNGIAAHLQADGVDLPHPGTRYELFCIVREALENVERHAGATQVQVLLRDMAPDVVLSVVDDGVGIDGDGDARSLQTNGHYGLIGMAERGERIGATVRDRRRPRRRDHGHRPPARRRRPRRRAVGARGGGRMIRVLIADDNAVIRQGVRALLTSAADDIEVVGEAATGREAIDQAELLQPDVVLLDIRMPVMDGVKAAERLSGQCKVMMLTYSDDEPMVAGAIRAGAHGYLVHGRFEPDELTRAVRDLADGKRIVSPSVAPVIFDLIVARGGAASPARGASRAPTR